MNWTPSIHFIRNHISPVSYYWLIILLLLPSWLDYVIFYTFFCIWCSFWCWYTPVRRRTREWKIIIFCCQTNNFSKTQPRHIHGSLCFSWYFYYLLQLTCFVSIFVLYTQMYGSNKIKTKSIICLLNSFSVLYFERHMQRPTKHDIEEIWIAFSVIVIHEVMLSSNNGAQNNLFMCVFLYLK